MESHDRRPARSLLLACALAAASPAAAWEANAGGVERRLARLDAAMSHSGAANSKMVMAEQDPRPSWADRGAWKERSGNHEYVFGVGSAEGIRNTALAVAAAEDRARASILQVTGEPVKESTGQTVAGAVPNARPIDWFRDGDGTLYALVVMKRAPPAEGEKVKIGP